MREEDRRRLCDGDQAAIEGEEWWYDDGEGSVMPGIERLSARAEIVEVVLVRELPPDEVT